MNKKEHNGPAFAILPYGKWPQKKLSQIPLDWLEWPIGRPKRLELGRVKDLSEQDHLITYPKKSLFFLPHLFIKAKISLMIVEPDINHNLYLKLARWKSAKFYKILTKNEFLLKKIKNGEFFYFGSTFIKNHKNIIIKKNKLASLIASSKNSLEGHKLRHEIVKYILKINKNISIMGGGYIPFKHKEDGLKSYRYSIVIESISERNYFSEKIVDACLLETVPIYWGAPNITDYFEEKGMIICKNKEEIKSAINKMNINDYNSRIKWIKVNKKLARAC